MQGSSGVGTARDPQSSMTTSSLSSLTAPGSCSTTPVSYASLTYGAPISRVDSSSYGMPPPSIPYTATTMSLFAPSPSPSRPQSLSPTPSRSYSPSPGFFFAQTPSSTKSMDPKRKRSANKDNKQDKKEAKRLRRETEAFLSREKMVGSVGKL